MRKSTKRTVRESSPQITPEEHAILILNPRIHLSLILDGNAIQEQFMSVAGVLNIASALAASGNLKDVHSLIAVGQTTLLDLVRQEVPSKPNEQQSNELCDAFNASDRLISIQRKHQLARAIQYVERILITKQDTDGMVVTKC